MPGTLLHYFPMRPRPEQGSRVVVPRTARAVFRAPSPTIRLIFRYTGRTGARAPHRWRMWGDARLCPEAVVPHRLPDLFLRDLRGGATHAGATEDALRRRRPLRDRRGAGPPPRAAQPGAAAAR